ncbi:hypothetical protein POM88_039159 [Heracleum sosnowskyi]|uniref:Uncharacterized protein n=1 Tax=Heracleum sosnowskyi TaxID=360622 RepID=A0AAD8HC85_9APIA|nr:hypothetical protein POM88_039159 [Heracleum sosnowskyi]
MDLEMAITQSLETSSQQGESIEIRHRVMATCTESSTLSLLTMEENIPIDDTRDTLLGEHLGYDTVPTIVTVEVPSQASEGKFDSLPNQIKSFSPLPEGTSLAPLRDFPLVVYTGESGSQPSESNTEAIQFQTQKDFLDFTRDSELRTLIAPPLTSLEGTRVIFPAGTSSENMDRQLVLRTESQTQSDTQKHEMSETPLREIEVEKDILKAQVVERSSSSTSVTNQLGTIKDEIEGLKVTLLPKMNDIQESHVLVASDISELTNSNAEITESVKQIASISTQVDYNQQTVDENQWFNDQKFARIEGGMEHLNKGMKHLYNMIKNSHQPNAEQKKLFEGDDDDDEDEGGEGRSKKEDPKADKVKSVEDSSTKGENKGKEKEEEKKGEDVQGGASDSGTQKDKGKGKLLQDDFYFQDALNDEDLQVSDGEDIFCEEEIEKEAVFDEWDDQDYLFNPDPAFEEELKKQHEEIRRKKDENAKVSQIISEKLRIQKAEHEEKQRLHSLEVKDRKLDIRLKKGDIWAKAKEMFTLPQKGSNNDREFISLLHRFMKVNPDNSVYMKALQKEILRITAGFDRVRNEMIIYVSCQSI